MPALPIAAISLTVYPVIAVGEVLGWRIPFLDPGMSFWVQAHPIYFFLVNLPMARFNYLLLRDFRAPEHEAAKELNIMEAGLTVREKEVLELLYLGYRYTEIAERLFLSLATVKTHIHHIYQKLGITRREELFIRSADAESTEGNGL